MCSRYANAMRMARESRAVAVIEEPLQRRNVLEPVKPPKVATAQH